MSKNRNTLGTKTVLKTAQKINEIVIQSDDYQCQCLFMERIPCSFGCVQLEKTCSIE